MRLYHTPNRGASSRKPGMIIPVYMRNPILIAFFSIAGACLAASPAAKFNGRWDITVSGQPVAWWLLVENAGTPRISGMFVGAPTGNLDKIPQISVDDGEIRFVFEQRYIKGEPDRKGTYRARLVGGKLEGTFEIEGKPDSALRWTGVRSPKIRDHDDGSWKPGRRVELFDGKDVSGWHSRVGGGELGWYVENGLLKNATPAPDLVSDRTFWNFTLHVEYRLAERSNSGVGLRGRYEVQIVDDFGRPPSTHGNGALYSRIVPAENASRRAGEWQTFDIRLVGREVTVVLNDRKIIDKREIDGLTALANNPDEGRPGPILLQGDHGSVEFRRIVITPLEK